jgi:hypothetical protein
VAAVVEWWQRKRERIKEGEVVVAVKSAETSACSTLTDQPTDLHTGTPVSSSCRRNVAGVVRAASERTFYRKEHGAYEGAGRLVCANSCVSALCSFVDSLKVEQPPGAFRCTWNTTNL